MHIIYPFIFPNPLMFRMWSENPPLDVGALVLTSLALGARSWTEVICSLYSFLNISEMSLSDPPGGIRQQTGSSSDIMGSCATAAVGSSVDRTTNEASKSCANEQNVARIKRPKWVFSLRTLWEDSWSQIISIIFCKHPNTVKWCTTDMRQCSGCVPSQRKH